MLSPPGAGLSSFAQMWTIQTSSPGTLGISSFAALRPSSVILPSPSTASAEVPTLISPASAMPGTERQTPNAIAAMEWFLEIDAMDGENDSTSAWSAASRRSDEPHELAFVVELRNLVVATDRVAPDEDLRDRAPTGALLQPRTRRPIAVDGHLGERDATGSQQPQRH